MNENYLTKYAAKHVDETFIKQLIQDARKAERQHCADLYAIRLVKLSARVLDNKMGPADSAALLQSESENIERQAQEWNYV
ncbi:DUF2732 family protein [Xenorhabdus cabanillasii]|uniref:Phage protein n=1 Tax=Xenorhabdus cabanillasii JM26 TaxID=1427517 RepID=W1J9J7_9GAMM|nr:DUF2732 family protein [Xenorhabdus cabanillasii]PHM74988.1 hypothetical protein Xcab_04273 [Xenorhabdus cabanillasii JM26]CDL86698.1 hypothetical protein XCR1_4370002 [Xenorhabdus cabanillasii JM26]